MWTVAPTLSPAFGEEWEAAIWKSKSPPCRKERGKGGATSRSEFKQGLGSPAFLLCSLCNPSLRRQIHRIASQPVAAFVVLAGDGGEAGAFVGVGGREE